MKKIRKIIEDLIRKEITLSSWMIGFLGIIMTRLFLDKFIAKSNSSLFDLIMDIHNILFFLLTFLLIWAFLSFILKEKPLKLSYLILWASLFVVFPPIFDLLKTHGEVYWSFYLISSPQELFAQFFSFFSDLPNGIVYFGTKIVFIAAIFCLVFLVLVKTKSFFKGFLSLFFSYLIFFIMASFPSFLAFIGLFWEKGIFWSIKSHQIIQWFSKNRVFGIEIEDLNYSLAYNLNFVYFLLILLFLFLFFYLSSKKKFFSVIKNFRYPQIVYHSGLLFLGSFLGILIFEENFQLDFFSSLAFFVLLISVWLSWKTSVIINDIYDFEIDEITNQERPLPQKILSKEEYRNIAVATFILAILGGFSLHYKIGWLLILYQFLAWSYSASPFRFKRFVFFSSFLSSLASLVILMVGFIVFSENQSLDNFPWKMFFLLLITYTLCLPIKDLKDIKGDEKYGVKTIPVLLGEEKGRLFIAVSFFVSYILSVFFLNEWNLFWWSLLFGSFSFWTLINKKIALKRLVWWNLGAVFVYGLILVKIIF